MTGEHGGRGAVKPYVQRQGQLLPALVSDALDPSDPVLFIDDVVDGLELTALEQRSATLGEHAYDPRLLLKLGRYAATQGVYSGRELAETRGMHRLLRLPWARRRWAQRKTQGERPFAEIKQAMRFRRWQWRGRANGWGEWTLVAAACPLRRLFALGLAAA